MTILAEETKTLRPMQIGAVTIQTPLVLAPMAGVTSHSFRLLCRRHGQGVLDQVQNYHPHLVSRVQEEIMNNEYMNSGL